MLKIRLQRTGRKKQPFFRVVVAEHTNAATGKFIEKLGHYNPLVKPWDFKVDTDKVMAWIKKGAKPTNTVARLLKSAGVSGMEKYIIDMKSRKKKNAPEEEDVSSSEDKKEDSPSSEDKTEENK